MIGCQAATGGQKKTALRKPPSTRSPNECSHPDSPGGSTIPPHAGAHCHIATHRSKGPTSLPVHLYPPAHVLGHTRARLLGAPGRATSAQNHTRQQGAQPVHSAHPASAPARTRRLGWPRTQRGTNRRPDARAQCAWAPNRCRWKGRLSPNSAARMAPPTHRATRLATLLSLLASHWLRSSIALDVAPITAV